jgi:hypothetical protein
VVLMGSQAIPGADRALELRGGALVGATHGPTRRPATTVTPIRRASR